MKLGAGLSRCAVALVLGVTLGTASEALSQPTAGVNAFASPLNRVSVTFTGDRKYRYLISFGYPKRLSVTKTLGDPGIALMRVSRGTFPITIQNKTPGRQAPLNPGHLGDMQLYVLYEVPASLGAAVRALEFGPFVYRYTARGAVSRWYLAFYSPYPGIGSDSLAISGRTTLLQNQDTWSIHVPETSFGKLKALLSRERPSYFMFNAVGGAIDVAEVTNYCPALVVLDGSGRVVPPSRLCQKLVLPGR